MSFTLSREDALKLLYDYTQSDSLRRHGLAVEQVMRCLARKYGEDEDIWGITGLLHDFDYERYPTAEEHPWKGNKILEELGYPEEIRTAIMGHANYTGVPRESLMAKALYACDELTGFIFAVTYVRPSKSVRDVKVKSVTKKLKDRSFAAKVSREEVEESIRELGVDRAEHIQFVIDALKEKAAELKGQMEESRSGIEQLETTTSQLRHILSSSQARGRWGERAVEDILQFIGLTEGIHYRKQSTQESGNRPDYTFFLPRKKLINMDVKFPFTHYERYLQEENEELKEKEKKQFLADVKRHIKTVAGRDYVNPEAGSVDYVLMFIPFESMYAFLNQEDHELIDYALSHKILLCSPITLYAILSLIRQAVSSFAMEQRAGEIQNLVHLFKSQWDRFVDKMDKLGHSLGTAQRHYDELRSTRTRQLEKPVEKILELDLKDEQQQLEAHED
ncbi:MAG: DNA recombination protein RmuC [Candidatus Neomarinimicrobiota bacterium]|nr:MAG: DNA recombination protein RmuC [Candidatus Neomarinimicrobiota bacterium]